jgi:hypothetical protein
MAPRTTTQTTNMSSTATLEPLLSRSSERVIHSARSLETRTTFSTTTTTCSRRWAALMTISFHRHLGWDDRHMVSERHLGELTCEDETLLVVKHEI